MTLLEPSDGNSETHQELRLETFPPEVKCKLLGMTLLFSLEILALCDVLKKY